MRSNPRYADAYNNLAIVLARQGKYDEAILSHKAGLQVRDDRSSDHNNLCRVYMQKGDLDAALNENSVALRCDPNFLGAWMSREEICIKQKDLEQAAKCVQRMIEIDPRSPETRQAELVLAGTLIDLKQFDESIVWLSRILEVNNASPEVYNARGLAYAQKGDLNHAKQDFEQVVRLMPQFPRARENLAAIEAQLARPHK